MGVPNSTPSDKTEIDKLVWEEIETTGARPATDVPTHAYNKLAVSIGDNTYFFGNGYVVDNETHRAVYSSTQIHVFNATSRAWRKIEAVIPAKKFGDAYYGAAIGCDIWILHEGTWYCFDTTKDEWRSDAISTPCRQVKPNSMAVHGDKIYIYNNDYQIVKGNIVCLDTKEKTVTVLPDAFGEHPEDRRETYLFMLEDNTIGMFAPEGSDSDRGEFFYYDLKENKWAQSKVALTKLGKDTTRFYSDHMAYAGRVDNTLYYLGPKSLSKRRVDTIWGHEIGSENWIRMKIGGDTFPNQDRFRSIAVDDTALYYFTKETRVYSLKKSFMNQPISDIPQKLTEQARKELDDIKPPVIEIHEFSNEPVVTDAQLSGVKEKLDVHYRIEGGLQDLNLDKDQRFIEKTLPKSSPTVLHHKNFMHYLTLAWSNHFSVVISPDVIFYTILCEIADQIKNNPEDYRSLFTDSMAKKQIITITASPEQLDLDLVIKGIAKNTPVDAEIFTANFSSSTGESRLAMNAAFCDAMSPYYDYCNTCCGIPRVKVLGTKQDWTLLEQKIHRMRTEVFSHDMTTDKSLSIYLTGAEQQIRLIHTSRNPEFWRNMFSINRCGSGHTDQVKGWICLFYRESYQRRRKTVVEYYGKDFYNYESHISQVKWTNLETERKFKLETGLLYSNIVKGTDPLDNSFPWLDPQFAHYTEETTGRIAENDIERKN